MKPWRKQSPLGERKKNLRRGAFLQELFKRCSYVTQATLLRMEEVLGKNQSSWIVKEAVSVGERNESLRRDFSCKRPFKRLSYVATSSRYMKNLVHAKRKEGKQGKWRQKYEIRFPGRGFPCIRSYIVLRRQRDLLSFFGPFLQALVDGKLMPCSVLALGQTYVSISRGSWALDVMRRDLFLLVQIRACKILIKKLKENLKIWTSS